MTSAGRRAMIALFVFAVAAPWGAHAQGPAAPAEYPEAREITRLILDAGQYDVVINTAVKVGLVRIRQTAERQIGRSLTAEEEEGLRASFANAFRSAVPSMVFEEASARTLAANVSQRDAQEILAFYRSPFGAKLLALHVVLVRASEASTEEIIRTRTPEFTRVFVNEVVRRVPELAREIDAAARRSSGK